MSEIGSAVVEASKEVAGDAQRAAEQAQNAAAVVTEHAAHIAATAVETAQERTAEIEARTAQAIGNQEEQLSWLRNHAEEHASRLTATMERQTGLETMLAETQRQMGELLARLTPPVSEEPKTPTAEPANQEGGAGDGQKAAEQKRQKNHSWM